MVFSIKSYQQLSSYGHNLCPCRFTTPSELLTKAMPRQPQPTPVKGEEITIIAGSYKGKQAWKNNAKAPTPKMVYVIINMGAGDDGADREITTRIKKTSIGARPEAPSSFEEAAIQQIPEIRYHLKKAAQGLAKCQIEDWDEVCRLFQIFCLEEQIELEALGPKASYYNVQYNEEL